MIVASLRNKEELYNLSKEINLLEKSKIVFFCIGSNRCICDSIGPKIGSMLKYKGYEVIGTIENPVHALNMYEKIIELEIYKNKGYIVIAIDLCLPKYKSRINKFLFSKGSLKPGSGANKILPAVGDYKFMMVICKDVEDAFNIRWEKKVIEFRNKAVNIIENALNTDKDLKFEYSHYIS